MPRGGVYDLMAGQYNVKNQIVEEIGIYASLPLKAVLEPLFQSHPFHFSAHKDLSQLQCWILSTRPQLIILESRLLAKSSEEDLNTLKETLQKWGIVSLFVTKSVEDIQRWRDVQWPSVQFFHGPLSGKSLKRKVINLLKERLLLERPRLAVLSDKPYLLSHLEMILRNCGANISVIPVVDSIDTLIALACELSDVLLWDVTCLDKQGGSLYREMMKCPICSQLPIYLISEEKNPSVNRWWVKTPVDPHIYTPEKMKPFILGILETIYKKRRDILRICRDTRTGLYLRDTFLAVAEREMSLSARSGEVFSFMKITLNNMDQLEKKFGAIFTHELEVNLGLFIQNRVRSSDFVAKGKPAEILVLFPRLDRHLATLIGERLRQSFLKAASFAEGAGHKFEPSLEYEIFCYPHDVQTIEEIEQVVEGKGEYAARQKLHRPLKVDLAEE